MAKAQDLSRRQSKIVSRYYDHREDIAAENLGELVSQLWLVDAQAEPKKADRLWERAGKALAHLTQDDPRVGRVLKERDVTGLAKLATQLAGPAA